MSEKKLKEIIEIRLLQILAILALVTVTLAVNTCCLFALYEDSLPADSQKLRRF